MIQDVPVQVAWNTIIDIRIIIYIEFAISFDAHPSLGGPEYIVVQIQFLAGQVQSICRPVCVVYPIVVNFCVSL